MILIIAEGGVLAWLIGMALFCGAGVTEWISNLILSHQNLIVILSMIIIIFSNAMAFEVSRNKGLKILIGSFIDFFTFTGSIVVIFSYISFMASSFESHFLGMLLMFIPALCELVIISIVAIGGGAYVPYLISTYLTNEDKDTLIVMIIVKVLYTLLFLWACVQLLSMFYITQYYYLLFSNSMFDQIMKMVNFLPLCHL